MSYKVKRYLGYEPWGITNPWVFANFGQPQRGRGYVSPLAYKGHPPRLSSPHLGQVDEAAARAVRMERYTLIGLSMSAASLALFSYIQWSNRKVKRNARRPRKNNYLPGGKPFSRVGMSMGGTEVYPFISGTSLMYTTAHDRTARYATSVTGGFAADDKWQRAVDLLRRAGRTIPNKRKRRRAR